MRGISNRWFYKTISWIINVKENHLWKLSKGKVREHFMQMGKLVKSNRIYDESN